MNNEFESKWMEVVSACFKVLPWHFPEGLKKTTKTGHLPKSEASGNLSGFTFTNPRLYVSS
jgi:hypothetical protein